LSLFPKTSGAHKDVGTGLSVDITISKWTMGIAFVTGKFTDELGIILLEETNNYYHSIIDYEYYYVFIIDAIMNDINVPK